MNLELADRLTRRVPGWVAPVLVAGGAVVATATVGLMDPELRGHLSPGCPFRSLTGLDCPGCGSTRALYALTQGDVGLALEHNVLTVMALPLLALAWLAWFRFRIGLRDRPLVLPPALSIAVAATFVAFWIVRNLPWFPFRWLGSLAG